MSIVETRMSRYRRWCFTLNNYTDADEQVLQSFPFSYLLYGHEVAPSTGTPHLQGYCQLATPSSLTALKANIGINGLSLRYAKGSPKSNETYCKKEDSWIELGTCKGLNPGKRNDLAPIRDQIKAGNSLISMMEDDTLSNYQAIRMAEKIYDYFAPKRSWKTRVFYIWGPTGVGKSYVARTVMPDAYWAKPTNKWWPGYDAHKHVLMDDVRGSFCTYSTMLRLLDENPFVVEYKGGCRQFLAEVVIMTSCKHPKDLYDVNEDKGQLLRRIEEIIFLPKDITRCQKDDIVQRLSARIAN